MTAKKPASPTQSTTGKGTEKTAAARADGSKSEPSTKAPPGTQTQSGSPTQSTTGKGAEKAAAARADGSKSKPSRKAPPGTRIQSGSPTDSAVTADTKVALAPQVTPPDAAGGTDGHSAINAMAVMKQAETDKNAAQARTGRGTQHVSAAQAIAKAAVRDHPAWPRPPNKPVTVKKPVTEKKVEKVEEAEKKPVPTPSRTADLPQEPKEPIGGFGAEGLPPPVVDIRDVEALLNADHPDPFSFLGMHAAPSPDTLTMRVFVPKATAVKVLDATDGKPAAILKRVHDEGLFVGSIRGRTASFPYRLRITTPDGEQTIEDPYRFPPVLSDPDTRKLSEYTHFSSYRTLGAHRIEMEGIAGVAFAVWAPHAARVAVVGDFNGWDGRRHGMRLRHEPRWTS